MKKGRWAAGEEGKLLELINKHGVGESWARSPRERGLWRRQPPPCPQRLPSLGQRLFPLMR